MPKRPKNQRPKNQRPKKECCSDKPKCGRCPLRMLKEGTLPDGFTVKKRRLVKVEGGKKAAKKAKSGKRGRLADAA